MRRAFPTIILAAIAAAAFWGARPHAAAQRTSLSAVAPSGSALDPRAAEIYGVVPNFSLTDSYGKKVRLSDIPGPWIADFIFTRCSGQCPLMTDRMRELERTLPGVRLVSISVDAYDRPRVLARYASSHGANWLFLSGKSEEVARLCRDIFKLPVVGGDDPREPILHSNKLVLVDRANRIRGYFDANDPVRMTKLLEDARLLR